ncbi:MAG: polysaccharide biosynthesis tyrosine autokinase [Candidatus Delongbacteria bacterium]|nr:polysaccharide biosynthesis tyrosine autokinase [Candidatus Delongbacteria bacterium]MBN2835023.1 polysaccharide biosynthesis tyrosine autokinase [Candidatus Delongbacteria bacterium]
MFEKESNELEQQISWREYFSIVYRGRWWIALIFIVISLISTYYTMKMPPVFQAETSVEIRDKNNMYSGVASPFSMMKNDRIIANNIQLIKSRSVAKMVLDEIDDSENAKHISISSINRKDLNENSRINLLISKLDVKPIKDTDILSLVVQANNPYEASFIANTYARQYELYSKMSNLGEVGAVTNFLKDQLEKVKTSLKNSEEKLQVFQNQSGIVKMEDETKLLIEKSAYFETKYREIQLNYEAANQKIKFLEQELDEKTKRIVDDISNSSTPEIQSLKAKAGEIRAKMMTIEINKKAGYKTIIKDYEDQIKEIERQISDRANFYAKDQQATSDPLQDKSEIIRKILDARSEQLSLKAQSDEVKKFIDSYNEKIDKLPNTKTEYARLQRQYEIDESAYIMMENKYNEYKIALAGQVGSARIVDEAVTPTSPIKPNKPLYIAIGIIAGLGLGILFAFLLAFFDNSIKTIEDISKLKLTLLGSIPTINLNELKKKMIKSIKDLSDSEKQKIESRLISHFSPKSPISEAYRTLRTNIQFSKVDDPPRIIAVSSSIPKEGKSTTASNLAVVIAQSGKKVVLVDADLRRPVVHKNFNLLREIGITDYLLKNSKVDEIAKKTDIENLHVITCGDIPPNPSELLGAKKMDSFINDLKEVYDFVIFDTPPVITVTDAAVLSRKTDGLVLVVSSGSVSRVEVERSKDLLDSVGANIIGIVLNNLDIKKLYGSYYYYYHYYHYYYYYGSDSKKRKRRK